MAVGEKPVLWHIPLSHYSEKVRWALAHKGIEHTRRKPQPPLHMLVAMKKTGGKHNTFPVLQLNGDHIGDSTAIIEALESRFPTPALYPEDADERRRALELEEWFDENLGPDLRFLAWHELVRDEAALKRLAVKVVPAQFARASTLAAGAAKSYVNLRYRVKDEERAAAARAKVLDALDHLEAELGDRDYLVGNGFTVADLTAAALFYPLVLPAEGPQLLQSPPEALDQFREPLKERRGYRWVEEMFRRHRKPAS